MRIPLLSLMLPVAAQVQAKGGIVAIVDLDKSLNMDEARAAGCIIPELLISQPDTPEQAAEIAEHLARSGAVDLIISVPLVTGGVES